MDQEQYLQERVEDQITWYGEKSQLNKKWFKFLRITEIVGAAIIPFLAGIGSSIPYYSVIIGTLGVIIAISAGVSAVYKFHENWLEYRTTSETLKHEKYLFQTKCRPYDQEDSFSLLVQRVEGLISKENSQWSRHQEKPKNT